MRSFLPRFNLRRLLSTRIYPPMTSATHPPYELIMYSRSMGCPFVTIAKRVLTEHQIVYREVLIDRDAAARERVVAWTGFQSVPTLVAARHGELDPHTQPPPLAAGASPRGVHRGAMITEPTEEELIAWLQDNGFLC
ncbi:glutaredoxin family protein [Aggregatilineales bacterium SYSU G02658]